MDDEHDQAGGEEPPGSSPMPLSMPPFTPPTPPQPTAGSDAEEASASRIPGAALPGDAGGAPPYGGQPPYLPPYGSSWPPGGLPAPASIGGPPAGSGRSRALLALAAVALLTGGLGAGLGVALTGTSPTTPQGPGAVPSGPSGGSALFSSGSKRSVAQIVASVEPAVVDIRTTVVQPVGQAAGTGMILTSSGEVLTNNHVVENASSIEVTIADHHGSFPAKVIGVNPTKDVALLQIQGVQGLPYVHLGNSATVAVGDPVVAIGNALGLGGTPSVVTGEISSTDRTITASDPGLQAETLHHLLQTTAPIQQGDSGGPLVNGAGKVIGMDTANVSNGSAAGATIGFAIPIDEARTIVEQMRHHVAVDGTILGSAPFLGIYEASPTSGTGGGSPFAGLPGFGASGTTGTGAAPVVRGVAVSAVVSGSPADRAGIQAGDVITAIGGEPTPTWPSLRAAIAAKRPGEQVGVTLAVPGGGSRTVQVVLGSFPPR